MTLRKTRAYADAKPRRVEVIVVDDGSTDANWNHDPATKARFPRDPMRFADLISLRGGSIGRNYSK